jgi:uncharacterized membrane-anchored protein
VVDAVEGAVCRPNEGECDAALRRRVVRGSRRQLDLGGEEWIRRRNREGALKILVDFGVRERDERTVRRDERRRRSALCPESTIGDRPRLLAVADGDVNLGEPSQFEREQKTEDLQRLQNGDVAVQVETGVGGEPVDQQLIRVRVGPTK